MTNTKNYKVDKDIFLAGMFFLVALVFRLSIVSGKDFVLNDGGLFAFMVDEIIEADFQLPYFTGYNISDIPFAYPPLALYLAALIVKISGASVLSVLQYFPAILSAFTVPAVYFLGKNINFSDRTIYLSTAIYTFIPRSWLWLVMGGGLTRSLGIFFAILAVSSSFKLFSNQERKELKFVVLFISLTILSHPEAGYFVVLTVVLIWLLFSLNINGTLWLMLSGLGTLILSSVWWLPVFLRHGINPFWAAIGTGGEGLKFFRDFLLFGVTGEVNSHLVAALSVVGFFYLISEKKFFLPLWILAILKFIPRSGGNFVMIPVALMSGLVIGELILPNLKKYKRASPNKGSILTQSSFFASVLFIVYLFVSTLVSSFMHIYSGEIVLNSLTDEDMTAMEWVSENTSPESKFIILVQDSFIWNDYIGEWFPYISQRESVTTLQGTEWLDGEAFKQRLAQYNFLQHCLGYKPDCVDEYGNKYNIFFTHIYFPKDKDSQLVLDSIEAMKFNQAYILIYDGPGASVFQYAP